MKLQWRFTCTCHHVTVACELYSYLNAQECLEVVQGIFMLFLFLELSF